jgi:hypothetical protein
VRRYTDPVLGPSDMTKRDKIRQAKLEQLDSEFRLLLLLLP